MQTNSSRRTMASSKGFTHDRCYLPARGLNSLARARDCSSPTLLLNSISVSTASSFQEHLSETYEEEIAVNDLPTSKRHFYIGSSRPA